MGAHRLILIDPKCEIGLKAQQSAATGQAGLQNRTVYNSWNHFFENEKEGVRISFTARDGKGRQVRDFNETLTWLKNENTENQNLINLYLIFGPEDWGLSADDLGLTHFACSIPTFGDNTSLNLSQATLLALYTLRLNWGGELAILEGQQPPRNQIDSASSKVFPEEALRVWLEEMGFDLEDRRVNAYTVLKRMLLHNVPNPKELQILETVLQQGIRKLREYNSLRKEKGLPAARSSVSESDKQKPH